MTYRYYSSTAVQTSLTSAVTSGATMLPVGSVSGFPTNYPYTLILDLGTTNEEVVTVTSASGLTLTVTRGTDGTPAVGHATGAAVIHGVSAQDFADWQNHDAATGAVHGVASTIVGTTDTQTLTNKTLTSPTVNSPTVSNPAISNPTITGGGSWAGSPTLTTPTIASLTNAQHNHSNAAGGGSSLVNPNITGPTIHGTGGTGAGSWADNPTFTNGFTVASGQSSNFNGSNITGNPAFSQGAVVSTGQILAMSGAHISGKPDFTGGLTLDSGQTMSASGAYIDSVTLQSAQVNNYIKRQTGGGWTTPTLGTGWGNGNTGGTFAGVRFRIDAEDFLVISGMIHTTASGPSTTVFSTGVTVTVAQAFAIGTSSGAVTAVDTMQFSTAGVVTLPNAGGLGSGVNYFFDVHIPIGNI